MIVILTQHDVERRLLDRRGLVEAEQSADAIVVLSSDGGKFQVKKIRALDMGAAKDAWFSMSLFPAMADHTQNGFMGKAFEVAVMWEEYQMRVHGEGKDELE